MLRIAVNTPINRPAQEVWDFFIDLANSSHWTRSGSELRQISAGPLGVGARISSVRPMFGREIKSQTIVVTQYEPGQLLAYTADVPLLGHTTGGFTFESIGGSTRLSRWGELELGRAEGLFGPTLTRVLRGGWGTEMSNLKRLIEARS
ncbi:MAG: SRPBCC family protein [Candidatus Limnocylindrales bacterium]|nr:SRPBCC family protein [Candidatus Limnocylindrales bacterium]